MSATHTHTHTLTSACKLLLLQEGVLLSRSSRWSKLDPNCASHVLSLHSSHRAQHPLFPKHKSLPILKGPTRSLDGTLSVVKVFSKNLQTSGLKNIRAAAPKNRFLTGTVPRTLIPTDAADPLILVPTC